LRVGVPLACAVYGVVRHSNVALGAAIGGLIGVMVVRLYQQQRYADLFRQVCTKVEAHQAAESTEG
jgi:hypothetical protein